MFSLPIEKKNLCLFLVVTVGVVVVVVVVVYHLSFFLASD